MKMRSRAGLPMATGCVCSMTGRNLSARASRWRGAAGVVGARLGWAKLSENGININVLTSARLTDLGGGATFYSTLVEVERVAEHPTVS